MPEDPLENIWVLGANMVLPTISCTCTATLTQVNNLLIIYIDVSQYLRVNHLCFLFDYVALTMIH
jgi:hypothetical protein